MAEEPSDRTSVRVVVVGDVAHVVVDVVLEREVLTHDHGQSRVQLDLHVLGRTGVVAAPHDHRYGTDLTLCDPAELVLVEPRSDASFLTEVALSHCPDLRATGR